MEEVRSGLVKYRIDGSGAGTDAGRAAEITRGGGSLDPMTGEETFSAVTPIGPRSVPQTILEHEAMAHLKDMEDALTRESVARALRPPKLETTRLDMGTPVDPALNGTIRYMFPFSREH